MVFDVEIEKWLFDSLTFLNFFSQRHLILYPSLENSTTGTAIKSITIFCTCNVVELVREADGSGIELFLPLTKAAGLQQLINNPVMFEKFRNSSAVCSSDKIPIGEVYLLETYFWFENKRIPI